MTRTLLIAALAVPLFAQDKQPAGSQPTAAAPVSDAQLGWRTLFDGKSLDAFRGYRTDGLPDKGWSIDGNCIKTSGGGGDLITRDQFGDFELEFEFKLSEKANSGVMIRVAETADAAWQTGPEYQVLDDAGNNVAADAPNACGGIYDLCLPNATKKLALLGEFNLGRIRLRDGLLTHWLNGQKVAEAGIGSDDWNKKVEASKFKAFAGFAKAARGHIALQEHGGAVWYRNIRIRELDQALPGEVNLLNGKNLDGWKAFLNDGAKMEDVWSVRDGVLICKGSPAGYIHTAKEYRNFILRVQWRWSPETKKTGNSGVLLRVSGPAKVWPRCLEAQLEHGNAGDFWKIENFPASTDAARTNGRNCKKLVPAERAVGEWNEYEIVAVGGVVRIAVNGELENVATECDPIAGVIALQSEGTEIHFRNVRIVELP